MPETPLGTLSQNEVQDLLGVSTDTLKKWRSTASQGTPLHLPAIPSPASSSHSHSHSPSRYATADLLAFLQRNALYRDRVLAAFAPDTVRASLEQLRGYVPMPDPLPADAPAVSAWADYFAPLPDQQQVTPTPTPTPQGETA